MQVMGHFLKQPLMLLRTATAATQETNGGEGTMIRAINGDFYRRMTQPGDVLDRAGVAALLGMRVSDVDLLTAGADGLTGYRGPRGVLFFAEDVHRYAEERLDRIEEVRRGSQR